MWEIRALRPGQLHQTLEIQLPTTEVLMEIELIMREVRTSFLREPPRAEPRFFCLPCRDSLSFSSLGSRRCAPFGQLRKLLLFLSHSLFLCRKT